MSESQIKKLFGQSSHYALGTAFITLSHLVTFPIFTRVFTVSEYGILSLVTVSISTFLALSKLGMGSAAVRMYEEYKTANRNYAAKNYYSTFFFSACASGLIVSLVYILFIILFSEEILNGTQLYLFLFVSLILFTKTINAILHSFFRAEQNTKFLNLFLVFSAYGGSALCIFLVFYFIKGLWGFYAGQLIVEVAGLAILLNFLTRKIQWSIYDFSWPLLKTSLKYGLPLVGLEFLNHILTYGDRFLIQMFCSSEDLGIYSVGYNLSSYVSNILLVPLSFAVTPLLMQTWTRDGKEATKKFLTSSLRYVSLIFFPIIAGFIAVGDDLLVLLASSKYNAAISIIPYAVIGVGLFALSNLLNAGLIIYKRTDKILIFAFVSALINIILNLVLIPRFNILGAAVATLVAYTVFFMAVTVSSYKLLSFEVPFLSIGIYICFAALMVLGIRPIAPENVFFRLTAKILSGCLIYSSLIFVFDQHMRQMVLSYMRLRLYKGGL